MTESRECGLCHRIGYRGFVPWGSEGWCCRRDDLCRRRQARRADRTPIRRVVSTGPTSRVMHAQARKQYNCGDCMAIIAPGQWYEMATLFAYADLGYKRPQTSRRCRSCAARISQLPIPADLVDVETFRRPDGRVYVPRRPGLRTVWFGEESAYGPQAAALVIGTHDHDRADAAVRDILYDYWDRPLPDPDVSSSIGWFRARPNDDGVLWVSDPVRGQPGVEYTVDLH